MSLIQIPRATRKNPQGCYGTYFKISPTKGVKVLDGSFRTEAAAYNSRTFDMAKEEAEILKVAQSSGVVPECYGVRVVKRGKTFKVGILMQHLGHTRLKDLTLPSDVKSDIYDMLNDALDHAGVAHNDLHEENIMYFKGEYYAIDFSPDCSDINDCN